MNQKIKSATIALEMRYGATSKEYQGEMTLAIPPENLVKAALALRDEFEFDMLVDITAVDYWPEESPRFHLVVQLVSTVHYQVIRLRAGLQGNSPTVHTLEGVFPNANWYEREVYDLFGIQFEGHSDKRRIIMPYDWVGHPLRKDYPLGYEEVQYTFNYDEVMKRKPHPRE